MKTLPKSITQALITSLKKVNVSDYFKLVAWMGGIQKRNPIAQRFADKVVNGSCQQENTIPEYIRALYREERPSQIPAPLPMVDNHWKTNEEEVK